MSKLNASFVLVAAESLVEFFPGNATYHVYRVAVDAAGKVTDVKRGHVHYTTPRAGTTFGKFYHWVDMFAEDFSGTQDKTLARYTFDAATGMGIGNSYRYIWCNEPVIGEPLPANMLPIVVKATKVPTASARQSTTPDGGTFVKVSRKVVASKPVTDAPVYELPVYDAATAATMSRVFAEIPDGTTQNDRDAADGKVRQTASARKLAERKASKTV